MQTHLSMIETQRAALWNRAKAMLDVAAAEKRELSPVETVEYDLAVENLESMRGAIDRVKAIEAGHAANKASAADWRAKSTFDARSGYTGPRIDDPQGIPASERWLPTLGEYRELCAENRAVGTTGAFIPVAYSNVWFDQLRKRVGVLASGPTILSIVGAGSMKVPSVTSSITVSNYAEAATITPSDPGFSTITLDPKKLAAITVVDREAIEDSNPQLQTIVQNSLMKDFAVALGSQLAVGDGTGANLLGLLNIAGYTAGPSTGTNGGSLSSNTTGFGFLADTLAAYDGANLDPDKAAWLMHARTWASVRRLTDLQGRPLVSVDPSQGISRTLWGRPVYIDNTLPITQTVGSSSNCSTIVLFDPTQIVVGVSREVELVISTDAYFASDQVGLRVSGRFDIGAPQPTAIVKTVGILP